MLRPHFLCLVILGLILALAEMQFLRKSDRMTVIYVLDQGQVVEFGDHATLSRQDGLYARLCRLQFQSDLQAPENDDVAPVKQVDLGRA